MTRFQLIRYQTVARHILLLIVSLLIGLMTSFGQDSAAAAQTSGSEAIFTVVETHPNFPGGISRFQEYIRKNLRYPQEAIKANIEGRVFVSFIIMKDGSIRDVNALKGRGYGTNEEAVRLVQSMPNWIPGKQAGQPVNVKYNVVIPFELSSVK